MNQIHLELGIEFKTVNDLCEKARSFIIENNSLQRFISKKEFVLIQEDQRISIMETPINSKSLENTSYGIIKIIRTKRLINNSHSLMNLIGLKKQHRRRIYEIDRFLSFFNEKIFQYYGVIYEKFSQYFLESLIRFNNKDEDFYSMVCQCIHSSKLVRNSDQKSRVAKTT